LVQRRVGIALDHLVIAKCKHAHVEIAVGLGELKS
jgi:hypothetical protein